MDTLPQLKKCRTCGLLSPLNQYTKNKRYPDGLDRACRPCQRKRRRDAYARRIATETPEQRKQRLAANNDHVKEYYEKNRERVLQYHKQRVKNQTPLERGIRAVYTRQWRGQNKETERERGKRYQAEHRDELRTKSREREKANRTKVNARHRAWKLKNPAKARAARNNYSARRKNSEGQFTGVEWSALCDQYDNRCLACGEVKPLTVDHVIPLIDGGRNDISNLQPLCLSCNTSKGRKDTDYRV